MPRRSLGPAAIAEQIKTYIDEPREYVAIEEVMRSLTSARAAHMIWRSGDGTKALRILRDQLVQIVCVNRPIDSQEVDALDWRMAWTALAGVAIPGVSGRMPAVGLYFPNGRKDDALWIAAQRHRAQTGGGAVGNLLGELATRRVARTLSGEGARLSLQPFQFEALNERNAAHRVLVAQQIPAIPKRAGGQYPFGIEPPTRELTQGDA